MTLHKAGPRTECPAEACQPTTERAGDLLDAARAVLEQFTPEHIDTVSDTDVGTKLDRAIEAAQKVESIGQKLANAVVVKRDIDRRHVVTDESRDNLERMKAEIASLMREMEVNSITSGMCWATLYHYGVEIGAYI